ncbi:MAG: protein tyrosine phosphatase family protein [Saccharospirillum sp.]
MFQHWRRLWPGKLHRFWPRLAAWADLLVVDLGLLRLPVNRPVEVVPGIWRSNQPTPWRLKALARKGFKSVLNLRGEGHSGAYHLEKYWCERLGLELHSIKLSSRRPPTLAQYEAVTQVLSTAPRPLLLHCKSGADRAGLVAAVAAIQSGVPTPQAKQQLSLRYLHIKQASTGMMDHFIEAYETSERREPLSLDDWMHRLYDREAVQQSFKTKGPGRWFVDRLLKRE